MTARKSVSEPVVGVDEARGNDLAERKDALLDELQGLRQRKTLREARYLRDRKRLDTDYANDDGAVDRLIARAERALAGVNAAQEAMQADADATNVVPLKVAAQ